MSDELSEDWYCPTCEDYVSGESVTFFEVHERCGTFIGEAWQKTKIALEAKLSKMETLSNAYKDLCTAYRVGSQTMGDKALTKL